MDPTHVTYAVGDVHGQAGLLRDIQQLIDADRRGRPATVVYLGDYVDRGPDSRGALDLVMAGIEGTTSVRLAGNHEGMLLDALVGGGYFDDDENWVRNGGDATLGSYGIRPRAKGESLADFRARAVANLPVGHLDFIRGLATSYEDDRAIYVHAGMRPGLALADQDEHDLAWIRGAFLDSDYHWGKPVVHGHTISPFGPQVMGNRICIDTGAFTSGFLTAVALDGGGPRFLVASKPLDLLVLHDTNEEPDRHWVQWCVAAASSSRVPHVGLCLDNPAAAEQAFARAGIRTSRLDYDDLVNWVGNGSSKLVRSVQAGLGSVLFSDRAAHDRLMRDVQVANAKAAFSPV